MAQDKNIREKLLPYQLGHLDNLINSLKNYHRVLDASDTGTGKTYSSIAAAMELGLKPFIICPKSVITSWKTVLKYFRCPLYGITNYESLQNCKMYSYKSCKIICPFIQRKTIKEEIHIHKPKKRVVVPKKRASSKFDKQFDLEPKLPANSREGYTYEWKNLPNDIVFIVDEAHRCKNGRTNNNVMLYTLAQTSAKIMLLSATVSDKPINFAITGFVLGLYPRVEKYAQWLQSITNNNIDPTSAIHKVIYPNYASRMRIKDLGKLFPSNQIVASCYDMDCAEEIEREYKNIEWEVDRLKRNEENSGCVLAQILYCRMRIEYLKAPTYVEEARKFLEEGNSVAIFVNFTETLRWISSELDTDCVIHGQQTGEERDSCISRFYNDKSQIIVCNISSGGVGINLHDTNGNYPRVSIISPGYNAQFLVQALGRVHRANGKTPVRQRIIFAANTIEEDICTNIKEKIKNIALINDNDPRSYIIEGMTTDLEAVVDSDEPTEFEKLFLRINVLNIKKERLRQELEQADKEIADLNYRINSIIDHQP